MWPNAKQNNPKEDKLKEYHRQQEKLKSMVPSGDKSKSMSTDVMIENLLNQAGTFKRHSSSSVTSPEQPHLTNNDLPLWLRSDMSSIPALYKQIWLHVQSPAQISFADTQKVSQLLLTSGLHTDILGYIWNLANKYVPGQLTEQELYIVLALVGLAQNGCTFNNLSVLNLIPSAPIPMIKLPVLVNSPEFSIENNAFSMQNMSTKSIPGTTDEENRSIAGSVMKTHGITPTMAHAQQSDVTDSACNAMQDLHIINTLANQPMRDSNLPFIGLSPTAELDDGDMDDDFTDFQSAVIDKKVTETDDFTDFQSAGTVDPLQTVVICQKREIPKIPLPSNISSKLTSILKISPESERKLKILSQAESLGSLPESKISISNKVSTLPSIAVVGSNRGVGSRLANHTLGSKADKPKHKHHKMKLSIEPSGLSTSKVLPPANVEELFPKCYQKTSNGIMTYLLKETKITQPELASTSHTIVSTSHAPVYSENSRKIELPTLGTLTETVLPTQPAVELLTVEEDKYSALRDLNVTTADATVLEKEEFGDFLSSGVTPGQEDAGWSDWSALVTPQQLPTAAPNKLPAAVSHGLETDLLSDLPLASVDQGPTFLSENQEPLNFPSTDQNWGDWTTSSADSGLVENSGWGDSTHGHATSASSTHGHVTSASSTVLQAQPIDSFFGSIIAEDTSASQSTVVHPDPTSLPSNQEESQDVEIRVDASALVSDLWSSDIITDPVAKSEWTASPSMQLNFDDFGDFLTSGAADAISRHSSLPSLDLKVSPTDEVDPDSVAKRCHEVCWNILQEALDIFAATPSAVQEEVFSTVEAKDYINCLYIVYHVSKRISSKLSELAAGQDELDKLWHRLFHMCAEYNIKPREDEDSFVGSGGLCGVCQGPICNDFVDHGSVLFHPSCANLWVNCVDTSLPCPAP